MSTLPLDSPLFPVAVAAQAALTAPGTMRMWLQRGSVQLLESDASFEQSLVPSKGGSPRLLTLRAVLTLATAAALVRKGTDVKDAYKAAKNWTWFGDDWDGQGPCPRDPAELYPEPDFTVLVQHMGENAKVVRFGPRHPLEFADLFASGGPVRTPPTLVLLNSVNNYARGVCQGFLRSEER
ncbi:MAG: hypothetical protein IAE97_14185 [Chthoniobacterales bacterium]|nr:hypothetical protein [Chthoniobacterales bacterium]